MLLFATIILCNKVMANDPEDSPIIILDGLEREGKNALYVEFFGSTINPFGLNFERKINENTHLRIGASYLGYSSKYRYEEGENDFYVRMLTIPVSYGYTFLEGIRQIEANAGLTFLTFSFEGGPYDIGYQDVEFGNQYMGLALTGYVGYRVSVYKYLFRIGVSPHFMLTIDNEVTGVFDELDARGIIDFNDHLEFDGFRFMPSLSFGRTF